MITPRLLTASLVLALAACAESSPKSAPTQPATRHGNAKASAAPAPIAASPAPVAPSTRLASAETPIVPAVAEKPRVTDGGTAPAVAEKNARENPPKPATPSVNPSRSDSAAPAVGETAAAAKPKNAVEPVSAGVSNLVGHVQLTSDAAVSAEEIAAVAVYFIPDKAPARAKPGRYLMYTHEKKFDPESLVVPVGSSVKFPNRDEILHNVFSATAGSQFDLGLIGEDGSGEHVFIKPGLVLVNCNVHSAMQATVLVVDTPFFARTSRDGKFSLEGLPAGSGKLTFWHPRAGFQSVAVTLPSSAAVEQSIRLTKPRVEAHMNKEGKPYQSLSH